MQVDDDDAFFAEYMSYSNKNFVEKSSSSEGSHMSDSLAKFIQKRYGNVSSFYNNEHIKTTSSSVNGFTRMKNLRRALSALDRGGWERSYHQRIFHESFLCAITKILFKTDPKGTFEQSYPRLLEINNWTRINQEILISTPRRFGKTVSVCLFVAALMFAAPSIEISIYSTCKRISGKLLRNCVKFLSIIQEQLHEPAMPFLKQTTDEIELQGPEFKWDLRKLNSYPSKVV